MSCFVTQPKDVQVTVTEEGGNWEIFTLKKRESSKNRRISTRDLSPSNLRGVNL